MGHPLSQDTEHPHNQDTEHPQDRDLVNPLPQPDMGVEASIIHDNTSFCSLYTLQL